MISEQTEIRQLVQQYFPHLSEPQLQDKIAEYGRLVTCQEGEVIMDFGGYIREVPLVIEGSIKVVREDEDGNELFLYYLQSQESCSMSFSCCMMKKRSEIRAVTEEKTTFIAIPTQYVDSWITEFTSWKNFVMRTYNDRLYDLVKVIDSIAFSNMDERLLEYLEKRALATSSKTIHATHQEIAYDLNTSRVVVSRLMKKLENAGYVKGGRNQLDVLKL